MPIMETHKDRTFCSSKHGLLSGPQERVHTWDTGRHLSVEERTDLLTYPQQMVRCDMSVGSNLPAKTKQKQWHDTD